VSIIIKKNTNMFQHTPQTYTMATASMEIFIILLWAFVLWMILGWLLKPVPEIFEIQDNLSEWKKNKKNMKGDDLMLIEWIDESIEKFFKKQGIMSFKDMVREDVAGLEAILLDGWKKFEEYNPATWPDQAALAMKWKWSELEEYQEILTKHKTK